MSKTIYTYTDLRNLGKCSFWDEIKGIPQITVTADLRKGLKGTYENDRVEGIFSKDESVKACEMRTVYELLFPKWTDDETKFRETAILSQFIREKMEACGDDVRQRRWFIGCRRNLASLLSAIIALEEAAVDINDLQPNGDKNIVLLQEAWQYLKEQDPAIDRFRNRLQELEQKEAWEQVFMELYGTKEVSAVVFHGFYTITPIQQRIMDLLENAGYQLIYLFSYDERYSFANEIWDKTYHESNGFPLKNDWIMEKEEKPEPYGEIFEGRKADIRNKLEIKEYPTVMDFVNGIIWNKRAGYYIYSANSNHANQILRDFYPQEYGERNLLAYPIGQFVSILNNMWDEDLQEIVLEEDDLIESFSSGWLAFDGKSAKPYMQDLINILPFFKGCKKRDEWLERITLLRQIYDDVIAPFRKNLSKDKAVSRWQEIMGNPFLNFGMFAVEEEKLDVILSLIKLMLDMAKDLFGENKRISIQEHVAKLDFILKEFELSNELYQEERDLISELFNKLNDPEGYRAECYPADISSALSIYMSGKFNEDELQQNKVGLVSPLFHVDAACIKQKGKIHICMCDIQNLPGSKKEFPWPLIRRTIKGCLQATENHFLRNMLSVIDDNDIANRYFVYTALKNNDVQLSYVKDMGDKLMSPSPYIKLLIEATEKKITMPYHEEVNYGQVKVLPAGNNKIAEYDHKKMPVNTPKEAIMDYSICPMKYAMGYVLEKQPVFQETFHQNYAVNGLIASIFSLLKGKGQTVDEIYNEIIKILPAMKNVEKRQVYDYLEEENSFSDLYYENSSDLANVHYTEERLKVRFPNKNVREQALKGFDNLGTKYGRTGMDFFSTAADKKTPAYKKQNLDVCLFCQHQSYCRYAEFIADQEALYD